MKEKELLLKDLHMGISDVQTTLQNAAWSTQEMVDWQLSPGRGRALTCMDPGAFQTSNPLHMIAQEAQQGSCQLEEVTADKMTHMDVQGTIF